MECSTVNVDKNRCDPQSSEVTKAVSSIDDWSAEGDSDRISLRGPRHSIFRKKYELETRQQRSCAVRSQIIPVFSSKRARNGDFLDQEGH